MIYLDNAATTKTSETAIEAMLTAMRCNFGNPSSLHSSGQRAAEALDGLPAYKMHCSVLAEEAIKKALLDYYEKNGIKYDKELFKNVDTCVHCHE